MMTVGGRLMVESHSRVERVGRRIVLAGTTSRRAVLDGLATVLKRRGMRVHVITGLEERTIQLLQASFRYRGEALYLVCGGPELPEPVLKRMEAAIHSNGAPSECVWSGALSWEEPEAVLREVEHRLKAMGLDASSAPPASRTMSAPTPPAPSQALLTNSTSSGKVPLSPVGASRSLARGEAQVGFPRNALKGLLSPRGAMIAGSAVVLLLVGFAAVRVTAGAGDGAGDSRAKLRVADAAGVTKPATEVQTEPSVGEPLVRAQGSEAMEPAAMFQAAVPEVQPVADIQVPQPEPPKLDDVVEVTDTAEVEGSSVVEDEPVGGEVPDDRDLIYAALENQSIRALDVLLVSPQATKKWRRRWVSAKMRFDAAQRYCEDLNVDGVRSWRLPDVGELGWLSRANLIRDGIYWTATRADAFGAEQVVWNTRKRRMGPASVRWKGGRVVCVRFHKPPGAAE